MAKPERREEHLTYRLPCPHGCEKGVDVEVVVRNTVLGYSYQEISVESVNHKYGPEGLE